MKCCTLFLLLQTEKKNWWYTYLGHVRSRVVAACQLTPQQVNAADGKREHENYQQHRDLWEKQVTHIMLLPFSQI
jgi:hypothetical protein